MEDPPETHLTLDGSEGLGSLTIYQEEAVEEEAVMEEEVVVGEEVVEEEETGVTKGIQTAKDLGPS